MFVVRNVFTCKPGRAKELVAKFKAAGPHLEALGIRNPRVLSDTSAGFWTVVVESEVESLDTYFQLVEQRGANREIAEAMTGYMDLVEGGRREIFKVE
jgi:hypothetical protein